MSAPPGPGSPEPAGFVRELGGFDATMVVAGSMIGSGIFIVSADIARQVGSPFWLLMVWVATGLMTVTAALSYGELAAMYPHAGGQYVYLREAFGPMPAFLYGWTLFLVIQSGTIAAVGVGFARYLGVLAPAISPARYLLGPWNVSRTYAISLSVQQLVAILMIVLLTYVNTRGLRLGKMIQNVFTAAKTASLLVLIVLGIGAGIGTGALIAHFAGGWQPRGVSPIVPEIGLAPPVSADSGGFGLFVAFSVAMVGSLFSSDAWNNITFTAGEVRDPRRNVPFSLALGTTLVISLYVLANVAYIGLLPLDRIQGATDDRVATAALQVVFGSAGAAIMAVAIIISTFGCNNGLILAGARVVWAMARDGVFFRATARLNDRHVPAVALALQGTWTALLVLPRTRLRDAAGRPLIDPASGLERYGNLYSNLLDYVVFSVLVFYVLTIAGIFVLRRTRSATERPYRAFGYPAVPIFYMVAAVIVMGVLIIYRTQTTWPGMVIILTGIPVYLLWHRGVRGTPRSSP